MPLHPDIPGDCVRLLIIIPNQPHQSRRARYHDPNREDYSVSDDGQLRGLVLRIILLQPCLRMYQLHLLMERCLSVSTWPVVRTKPKDADRQESAPVGCQGTVSPQTIYPNVNRLRRSGPYNQSTACVVSGCTPRLAKDAFALHLTRFQSVWSM